MVWVVSVSGSGPSSDQSRKIDRGSIIHFLLRSPLARPWSWPDINIGKWFSFGLRNVQSLHSLTSSECVSVSSSFQRRSSSFLKLKMPCIWDTTKHKRFCQEKNKVCSKLCAKCQIQIMLSLTFSWLVGCVCQCLDTSLLSPVLLLLVMGLVTLERKHFTTFQLGRGVFIVFN